MTELPKFVRFAPMFFYILGGISLFVGIVLPLLEFRHWGYSTDLPSGDTYARGVVLKFVLRQVADSSYLFANGLLLDVLIRIWNKIGQAKSGGSE